MLHCYLFFGLFGSVLSFFEVFGLVALSVLLFWNASMSV